ncbi:hypothetical protein D3C80_1465280 [compost metagenome]
MFDSVTMLVGFLGVLAVLCDQAFVVADHAGGLFLLNHQRLLEDTYLLLHLIDLRLVTVEILVTLFLNRYTVVLKSFPGVRMLFFQRLDLRVLLLESNLKVATALANPGVTCDLGLQTGLNRLELLILSLQC